MSPAAASRLGERHCCGACGAKYYDLGRADPACPRCGAGATPAVAGVVKRLRRQPHKLEIAGSSPAPGLPTEAPPLQASAPDDLAAGPAVRGRRRSTTLSLKTIARQARQAHRAPGPVCPACWTQPLRSDNTKGICGYCQAAGAKPTPPLPRCRAECIDGPRPCPHLGCRFHLFLDVNPSTGSIKFNFPGKDLGDLPETCALDVADRGGVTLEEVGAIMNLTRERIRQMETRGLLKLKRLGDELPDLPVEQVG